MDVSTKPKLDSTALDETQGKASEVLTKYDHLLEQFAAELKNAPVNPYASILRMQLMSFSPSYLKSVVRSGSRFLMVPNTLVQDLCGGGLILQKLEGLDDQTLRGIAECSRINQRRMFRRSVMGLFPKIVSALIVVLGAAKAIKETLDVDIFEHLQIGWAQTLLVGLAVGVLIGGVLNFILSIQRVRMIQAFDDLIAIAAAYRGTPKAG
jgi:hypothetical protein